MGDSRRPPVSVLIKTITRSEGDRGCHFWGKQGSSWYRRWHLPACDALAAARVRALPE